MPSILKKHVVGQHEQPIKQTDCRTEGGGGKATICAAAAASDQVYDLEDSNETRPPVYKRRLSRIESWLAVLLLTCLAVLLAFIVTLVAVHYTEGAEGGGSGAAADDELDSNYFGVGSDAFADD